ncbi:MAG: PadR family transcriptional regulator [Clostridia bacterium]|nr:PadR family transcriptional regulator [Clostridia bacterium]
MENQPSISSDLIRGHIDTIILHALTENDKYAQQISEVIESKSENAYKINQATLYSSLKRLETLKLVSSYWNDCDGGRRKFFKITEDGKKTVEENLSSWAYSRSIIDKLMNLSPAPTPVVVTKFIEKPAESSTVIYRHTETVKEEPKATEIKPQPAPTLSDEREKNFRNIINGLVEISNQSAHAGATQESLSLEPIETENPEISKSDVLKFNETINDTNYNANKSNFNNKIDYGDLTLKAEKEGYSIRISSKDSAKPIGNIFINKLNFVVSALIFIIAVAELGILYGIFKDALNSSFVKILSVVPAVPLIIFACMYFMKKNKLGKNKILADGILTAAIVAFNLLLVNLAAAFLFDVDFSNKTQLLAALIIPVIYYIDLILFSAIRFILSSKKIFSCK